MDDAKTRNQNFSRSALRRSPSYRNFATETESVSGTQ